MKKRNVIVKIVTIFAVLLCCLSTVGCVNNPDPGENSGGSGKISLNVWIQPINQPQFFNWAAKRYNELNPNVTINWNIMTGDTLGGGLDTALSGASAADISATWGGLVVPKLIAGNRILNLDDVMTPEIENNLNSSALINKIDSEGKGWYSVPFGGFASTIFYNKTFFDQNNIAVPETYEDLKSISKTIRDLGKEPLISGLADWQMSHFMQALHARTMSVEDFESLIGVDRTQNPFADPINQDIPKNGILEGFEWLQQYQKDGIFARNITGYSVNQAQKNFKKGSSVMYSGPSLEFLDLSGATFEIGAFLMPKAPSEYAPEDGNAPSSMASGLCSDVFIVNADTKYPEECKDFLRFLISEEAQKKLLEFFIFPAIKGVTTEDMQPTYKEIFEGVFGEIYQEIETHGYTPFYQSYSIGVMDGKLGTLGAGVIDGTMDPDTAAKELVKYYATSGVIKTE